MPLGGLFLKWNKIVIDHDHEPDRVTTEDGEYQLLPDREVPVAPDFLDEQRLLPGDQSGGAGASNRARGHLTGQTDVDIRSSWVVQWTTKLGGEV